MYFDVKKVITVIKIEISKSIINSFIEIFLKASGTILLTNRMSKRKIEIEKIKYSDLILNLLNNFIVPN